MRPLHCSQLSQCLTIQGPSSSNRCLNGVPLVSYSLGRFRSKATPLPAEKRAPGVPACPSVADRPSSQCTSPEDGSSAGERRFWASPAAFRESESAGGGVGVGVGPRIGSVEYVEAFVEQGIFNTRFFTLLAVFGSLLGAALCFVRGSGHVLECLHHFFGHFFSQGASALEVLLLVRALDVYLFGTVMLLFGGGLYELFIDSLHVLPGGDASAPLPLRHLRSSFFGLFALKSRPRWLGISSLDEMKTKLGHVIVMILLVGMFEKSKKVVITSPVDFLIFSTAVTMAAVCLWVLTKLHPEEPHSDFRSDRGYHSGP